MHRTLVAAAIATLLSTGATAETIGVSMARFDDTFLTVLRDGMGDYAGTLDGVELQVEDARNDIGRQLDQMQTFIASGVDAIIVTPVDTDATVAMSQAAAQADIPLVFVNRQPVHLEQLPQGQAFVGSDERLSGTLATREVCRLLDEAGRGEAKLLVLTGELSNQAARQRTQDVHDVIATAECRFMTVVGERAGNWSRTEARELMRDWLASGVEFDAVVANNDEMAIGAIEALKAAGRDMAEVVVAGVDATREALAAMAAGELDVTVFQDAAGQGRGAVDAALKLARGEAVERTVYVPFELVTPANLAQYRAKN